MSVYGGYCVIADVNLSRVTDLDDALDAVRMTARFLIRVNLMDCEYAAEVARTNRIGVSLTGIHEFAWSMFGVTFRDMIRHGVDHKAGDEPHPKIAAFWEFIDQMRIAAEDEAAAFSAELGLSVPHTVACIKPSGTISKVLNCTEGAHLPALAYYLRWVQYKSDDPDLPILRERGYPVKDISARYSGHMAVGFPTRQPIIDLMGDKVVTADEATVDEQYRFLRLLEQHWLGPDKRNNQISYTLKYDSSTTTYQGFMDMLLTHQPHVRCCSVMPQNDWRESEKVYGYVPEQPITSDEYASLMSLITPVEREGYDDDALACEGGACPIEFDQAKLSVVSLLAS